MEWLIDKSDMNPMDESAKFEDSSRIKESKTHIFIHLNDL